MTLQQFRAVTGAGSGCWADAFARAYHIGSVLLAAVHCDRAAHRGAKQAKLWMRYDLREALYLSHLNGVSLESVPYTQDGLRAAAERWRDLILTELDAEGREIVPQAAD